MVATHTADRSRDGTVARAIRIGIAMLALSAPVVSFAGNGVGAAPVDLARVPLSASVVAMADNSDVIVVDGYGDAVGLSEYNAYAASVSNLSSITANATGVSIDRDVFGVGSLGGSRASGERGRRDDRGQRRDCRRRCDGRRCVLVCGRHGNVLELRFDRSARTERKR